MSLREKLEEDYKAAMKAKDTLRVSVIRMARSEIRNEEIAKRRSLTEEEIIEVIAREIKRRR
ncbi:MAG: GatB/YqeY domain-containing protein, partial [Armatimonadota bacterium]|nr:GatB/YqeY domain-containing protein [Armatimonadota bacterium]